MARQPKDPNDRLRELVQEAGLSSKGRARRVIMLGQTKGVQGLRYNHSSVARWLEGEQPKEPVPELIAEVLSNELGRYVCVTDIGMNPSALIADLGLDLGNGWADRVTTVTTFWRAEVQRRRFLTGTTFAVSASSTAALRWLTSPPAEPPIGRGLRGVGSHDIQAIKEMTKTYRELDNRLGGVNLRSIVVGYLDTTVTPLLRHGRYNDQMGRNLAAAAAELAQLAGWLSYDTELHGLAQRHLVQALSLAEAAADSALCAEILAAMSHQSVYVGRPATAIDLARTGQAAAKRAGLPTLLTECYVMEAHGHAARDDARACAVALHRADKTFDRATQRDQPAWLAYFDAAYLSAKFGQCFRDLGKGDKAAEYARRSLDMDPRYVRGKTFNQTLLAVAHVQQGQVGQACVEGRKAIDLAATLSSGRAVGYLRDLRRRLRPYAASAEVRQFDEYARVKLPAMTRAAAERAESR